MARVWGVQYRMKTRGPMRLAGFPPMSFTDARSLAATYVAEGRQAELVELEPVRRRTAEPKPRRRGRTIDPRQLALITTDPPSYPQGE
jgi:hypothetical protein